LFGDIKLSAATDKNLDDDISVNIENPVVEMWKISTGEATSEVRDQARRRTLA
jgi:hypothetical protein